MWSRNTPLNIPSIRIKNSKNLYKNPNDIHTRYWQAIWGNLNFVFWDGLVCSPGWPPMLGLPGSASRMQASEMYVTPPRRSRSWGFFVFPPNNGSHYDIFFMHVSSSALPKRPLVISNLNLSTIVTTLWFKAGLIRLLASTYSIW